MLHSHSGSALKLLAIMTAGCPSLFACIYVCYLRLRPAPMRLALPAAAAVPLAAARRMCARALAGDEGAALAAPMARLHRGLSLLR